MEDWKEYRLGDIADCTLGKMLDQKKNKGIPRTYLGNVAVRWGSFNIDYSQKMLIEDNEVTKYELKAGDIVICEGGEPGRCAIWKGGTQIFIQKALHRVRVKKNIADNFFVYYSFCNLVRQGKVEPYFTGSTIKHLPRERLVSLRIPIPSLATQIQLASILKSLDDKIEVNMRINENLEQQAQALFKSWFVDYEPFRSKPFVESEIGMIPEGWSVVSLGEILEENTKSKIQVKQARDIKGEYPFFTSGTTVLEYDEFLVSGRNIFLNTGGVAGVNFYIGKAAYSTDTWCIKAKDDLTDFLYLYLSSVIDIINTQYFEGSALKHLKKKALKERKIAIPSMYIIDGFIKSVMPLFDKMISNKRQNRILSQLRDTLLPQLMSGELKVKDIEDSL